VLSVCYAAARHVVQPIAALQQAADAIAVGDYRQRIYLPHRDEIGSLARSFNRMSQELDSRMTQLRQSGQRQATVLGGMIEGVIAVDDRERVLFANRAAGRLFDFSPPAIEGRRLLEVVRVHALHEAVSAALANRRPQRMEAIVEAGDKLSIAIQATPLPGDPCPGAVLVLHDVTELRRLERVRQEFVANVSHELKTPLSSIKAYAETLQNGALNDRETSHRFVSQIEEQAERLHSLILDMLTLARIESDQQAFEIVPVAVGDVVTACLGAYQAAADTKHLHLSAEIDDADLRVQADREGLREILDNLVDNAIKYTPEQGRVTVRCRADGEFATIAVEDTGIGIAADELARVFERFYRVDKARSREMGGTGLGLSIVKHLAQSFEGEVGVESKKGQGTTFTVMLPLA
jgi:two-component system phosphate regulon sensor histidine kinase PhoR